jgi:sucrose-6-phosphate hydrolase SacC (GH32 family)
VSPDEKAFTRVYFDTTFYTFGMDGQAHKNQPQKSYLKQGEDVTMHIFLDRSIVEAYVNGSAQTARTFPSPEALGFDICSEGGEARTSGSSTTENGSPLQRMT